MRGRASPLDMGDAEATDALEALLGDAVAAAARCRCAARRVSVRRHRLLARRRADAGARQRPRCAPIRSALRKRDLTRHRMRERSPRISAPSTPSSTSHRARRRRSSPCCPSIYDEPFADSSQVPTYLLSKLTREHVTVALSGDGGDELFAGYTRHRFARLASRHAGADRSRDGVRLSASPGPLSGGRVFGVLPAKVRPTLGPDKIHKAASLFRGRRGGRLSQPRQRLGRSPRQSCAAATRREVRSSIRSIGKMLPDPLDRMQYLDTITYLPDDILTKVDRASMAVALEARVPILDHRVVEFSWRLPSRFKMRVGKGKWLLRQVLYRHVPKELVERPKSGFAVPIGAVAQGSVARLGGGAFVREAFGRGRLCSTRRRSGRVGRSMSRDAATGMPRYGPC